MQVKKSVFKCIHMECSQCRRSGMALLIKTWQLIMSSSYQWRSQAYKASTAVSNGLDICGQLHWTATDSFQRFTPMKGKTRLWIITVSSQRQAINRQADGTRKQRDVRRRWVVSCFCLWMSKNLSICQNWKSLLRESNSFTVRRQFNTRSVPRTLHLFSSVSWGLLFYPVIQVVPEYSMLFVCLFFINYLFIYILCIICFGCLICYLHAYKCIYLHYIYIY